MEKKFSKRWNRSIQPRKQRKYRFNAPLHVKQKYLSAYLSKNLREKYKKRNLNLRKGDNVKIMRGQFKNKTGKIDEVNMKKTFVYIGGIEVTKKDGTKTRYPIHPSNLMITEINLDDKMRQKILERE